jgi:hypothetical protein
MGGTVQSHTVKRNQSRTGTMTFDSRLQTATAQSCGLHSDLHGMACQQANVAQ